MAFGTKGIIDPETRGINPDHDAITAKQDETPGCRSPVTLLPQKDGMAKKLDHAAFFGSGYYLYM